MRNKEEENRLLQEEMEDARLKQEEATKALIAASTTPGHHHLQVGLDWWLLGIWGITFQYKNQDFTRSHAVNYQKGVITLQD